MEPATVQSLNPQGDLVVGVDGSQESFGALRWALRQAALSGQTVNAVYGWSYSWDMGPEPTTDEELAKLRTQIAEKLRDWVKDAAEGIDIDSDQIRLTSFRASGTSALLEIGSDAQQIHVMYCWQLKDMTDIPGYETSVPPLDVAQQHAEQVVQHLIASSTLPEGLTIKADVFHISAGKGLVSASRYCRHIVVGSRGLSGADAHFLGSVSKQLINLAECNLTIVH